MAGKPFVLECHPNLHHVTIFAVFVSFGVVDLLLWSVSHRQIYVYPVHLAPCITDERQEDLL